MLAASKKKDSISGNCFISGELQWSVTLQQIQACCPRPACDGSGGNRLSAGMKKVTFEVSSAVLLLIGYTTKASTSVLRV